MTSDSDATNDLEQPETPEPPKPAMPRMVMAKPKKPTTAASDKAKAPENKVVRLLEKNPLGMTLPEMAGGPRQMKKIKLLRPLLAQAIREGMVMPISQRAGNTVYRLVKYLGPR